MVAARDLKYPPRVGKDAFLHILHPGPVHPHRHLVLGLARHRAGVAPDAFAVIDYEAVFHSRKDRPQNIQSYLGAVEPGVMLLRPLAPL